MFLRPVLGLFNAVAFAVVGYSTVRFLYAVYGPLGFEPFLTAVAFVYFVLGALAFAFPWRPE
jgi:hypothetical protein